MRRIEDKVAIITGGTSGIGLGMVELFAEEGGKIVFCGRRKDTGENIEKDLREKGLEVTFVKADLTQKDDIENLVNETIKLYNRIDILIGNAGIQAQIPIEHIDTYKDFDPIVNTNLKSYFAITEKVLPHMLKQGKGSIVYTSSISGLVGIGPLSLYGATKAGVIELAKYGAVEFGDRNIRFNAVLPGLTKTGFAPDGDPFIESLLSHIPTKKMATPREIAYGALFFASDEVPSCTGTTLIIDGGRTCT